MQDSSDVHCFRSGYTRGMWHLWPISRLLDKSVCGGSSWCTTNSNLRPLLVKKKTKNSKFLNWLFVAWQCSCGCDHPPWLCTFLPFQLTFYDDALNLRPTHCAVSPFFSNIFCRFPSEGVNECLLDNSQFSCLSPLLLCIVNNNTEKRFLAFKLQWNIFLSRNYQN